MDPLCLGGGVGGGGAGGTFLFGNHEAIIRLSFNRNICTRSVLGVELGGVEALTCLATMRQS